MRVTSRWSLVVRRSLFASRLAALVCALGEFEVEGLLGGVSRTTNDE